MKYCHDYKSIKVPFVIFVDFGPIIEKTSTSDNSQASYTVEVNNKLRAYGFFYFCLNSHNTSKTE